MTSKSFLNPSRKDTLILAVIYLAFGLVLCMFQGSILTTIVRVLGIGLILFGIYELYVYFGLHRSTDMSPLVMGVPALVIGLLLAFWPHLLINFFPIIAGALLIFNSITQIQQSLVLKSANVPGWMIAFVLALLMLACGIFLVLRPSGVINTLTMITGIALIVEAIILVFDAFQSGKRA